MAASFLPSQIRKAPAVLARWAGAVNALLRFAKIVNHAEGRDGIRVTVTDNNMVISADKMGGGLPNGYGPEEFTICEDGAPVTRNFLTDNPD